MADHEHYSGYWIALIRLSGERAAPAHARGHPPVAHWARCMRRSLVGHHDDIPCPGLLGPVGTREAASIAADRGPLPPDRARHHCHAQPVHPGADHRARCPSHPPRPELAPPSRRRPRGWCRPAADQLLAPVTEAQVLSRQARVSARAPPRSGPVLPGRLPVRMVERVELVEVHEQHRVTPGAPGPNPVEAPGGLVQGPRVGQPGEHVGASLRLELLGSVRATSRRANRSRRSATIMVLAPRPAPSRAHRAWPGTAPGPRGPAHPRALPEAQFGHPGGERPRLPARPRFGQARPWEPWPRPARHRPRRGPCRRRPPRTRHPRSGRPSSPGWRQPAGRTPATTKSPDMWPSRSLMSLRSSRSTTARDPAVRVAATRRTLDSCPTAARVDNPVNGLIRAASCVVTPTSIAQRTRSVTVSGVLTLDPGTRHPPNVLERPALTRLPALHTDWLGAGAT